MSHKTKLVILSAFYEPYMSGAEQMVKELAEGLGEDYDITIITGRYSRKLMRIEDRRYFRIVRVGFGCRRLDKLVYPLWAAWAVYLFKPQITHAVMESYAGLALVLTKWTYSRSKRILTLQSGDLDDDRKQQKFYINWVWKLIHRSPDLVTAISTSLARRATSLGVDKERVVITPNGIDLDAVPIGEQRIKGRVVMVARLSWEKDHATLLAAWANVRAQMPDASLVLVGEGPERSRIEKTIKDLSIGDSVELKGFLPHDEALTQLCRAEVFVCPSLAEGLGNVFIEAQACGTPPIGTRVGGIPDVIEDGVNGLLVAPKNQEELSRAIIKLLSDNELRSQLQAAGQQSSRKFNWDDTRQKFKKIYTMILK